jgi:hypothetical protein
MKLHVWRATFVSAYSSSSGMASYTTTPQTQTVLVVTRGNSIGALADEITKGLGEGYSVAISSAEWLGPAEFNESDT